MAATTPPDVGDPLDDLRRRLHGTLVVPDDPAYDEARTLYNAMIEKRPRVIVYCADVVDVLAAVEFARNQRLELAVRSGGHNGAGLASVDDGLVVDLSGMRGVRVHPDRETVTVEAGCRWGDVDHATHAVGRATVSGVISTTGVGGLTLGGGHGYLTRKYGLTIDNLVGADVVLADGRFVHASADEHPDLFWALRGGGGNFGIVTAFEFRLHPVSSVIAGPMFWSLSDLESAMRWYREWLPTVPDDVYAFFLVAEVPGDPFPPELHGEQVCGLVWCLLGSPEEAEEHLDAARAVATPIFEHVGPMPYPALQSLFDGLYPPGDQWYWRGDVFDDLSDDAIAVHHQFASVPTPKSTMHLYPIDGAVHRVANDETPWQYRDARWSMVVAGVDPDPANAGRITDWCKSYWDALHPYSAGGAYVNFLMEEGAGRVRATYGPNYPRLQAVKAKYDPENLFHVNQNVVPAQAGG